MSYLKISLQMKLHCVHVTLLRTRNQQLPSNPVLSLVH